MVGSRFRRGHLPLGHARFQYLHHNSLVKILLPPSETKSDGTADLPLALESLSFPELTKTRLKVAKALISLSKKPRVARVQLGISEKLDSERLRNIELLTAKTSPAHSIYSGVVYDALAYAELPAAAKKRADEICIVQSALFGWVSFGDRIPPYRLSGDTKLFATTSLAQLWKPAITKAAKALEPQELIVDMRSGNYATHWQPSTADIQRTVVIKVVQEVGTGSTAKKIAVSHFNKATKGKIANSLLRAEVSPQNPQELHELLGELGYTSVFIAGNTKQPATLEIDMV